MEENSKRNYHLDANYHYMKNYPSDGIIQLCQLVRQQQLRRAWTMKRIQGCSF